MEPGRPRARAQDNERGSGIELTILMDRLSVLPRQCRAYKERSLAPILRSCTPTAKHTYAQETRQLFRPNTETLTTPTCASIYALTFSADTTNWNSQLATTPKAAGAAE